MKRFQNLNGWAIMFWSFIITQLVLVLMRGTGILAGFFAAGFLVAVYYIGQYSHDRGLKIKLNEAIRNSGKR